MGSPADNTVHYFIVMIRHGAHVIFSQMVSTRDAMVRGTLDIPNLIKLNDIREDFRVELQVSLLGDFVHLNDIKKHLFLLVLNGLGP